MRPCESGSYASACARRIHVIGIGAGDPDYVTAQADRGAQRHRRCSSRWTRARRRATWWRCGARSASGSSASRATDSSNWPIRTRAKDGDYRQAVTDWHAARARGVGRGHRAELGPSGVGAFLAWGDPSLYDSTLRILDVVAAARRHRLRRHPRHHRDPGADGTTSHPAQRHRRTGADHHRPAAARPTGSDRQRRWSCSTATARS